MHGVVFLHVFSSCFLYHLFAQAYAAHASHVLGVHFTHDSKYVVSIGGEDMTTLQWRVVAPNATEI